MSNAQRTGRPKHYREPRERINIELQSELIGALDILVSDMRRRGDLMDEMGTKPSRTSYIAMLLANDQAIRTTAARWRGGERP